MGSGGGLTVLWNTGAILDFRPGSSEPSALDGALGTAPLAVAMAGALCEEGASNDLLSFSNALLFSSLPVL